MRGAITKSIAKLISDNVNGSNFSNLYGNVKTKNLHFAEIADFPCCTVTPGPSTREYLPSNFIWAYLDVRIRLYIRNEEDPQGTLELLIADIENVIDSNLSIEYTITKANGTTQLGYTTNSTITSVTTDEGILSPLGFAEISLQIQYQK